MPISEYRTQITGTCECCNSRTHKSTGMVTVNQNPDTLYIACWTESRREHGIAFLILQPGHNTFVSVHYSFDIQAFSVLDPEDYNWDSSNDTRILRRDDVIGTPLAQEVFDYLDEIWLHDDELQHLMRNQVQQNQTNKNG